MSDNCSCGNRNKIDTGGTGSYSIRDSMGNVAGSNSSGNSMIVGTNDSSEDVNILKDSDGFFMARALELARLGLGRTSPNPVVGAVIVKDGEIVGEGYHQRAGNPHAEVHALNQAGEKARGATLYVTLEPCSHFGRTPPCADAVIRAGLSRAVVAMVDPNPLVAGNGIARLKEAGIQVKVGVLEKEARKLNEVFIKFITTGMPFVVMKTAMTLDGKIAAHTGDSRWVTGPEARGVVHQLRDRYDALLVGIGTVMADDPLLTTRLPDGNGRDPVRVVVDSRLRIPVAARVLHLSSTAPTVIACTEQADPVKRAELEKMGVEVVVAPEQGGMVDLEWLLQELARRGLTGVLVEGGSRINASLLARGLIDKVMFFIAPKLIGGESAPGPVGGEGVARMTEAVPLERVKVKSVGVDILVTGYPAGKRGG